MGKASYFRNSKVCRNIWSAIQAEILIRWPNNAVQVTPTSLCSCQCRAKPGQTKGEPRVFFAVHRLRVQAPFFIVIQQNWLQWAPILFPTNPTSMYVHIFVYSLYSYLYITYISLFFLNLVRTTKAFSSPHPVCRVTQCHRRRRGRLWD